MLLWCSGLEKPILTNGSEGVRLESEHASLGGVKQWPRTGVNAVKDLVVPSSAHATEYK
jgi:hypothetical protein